MIQTFFTLIYPLIFAVFSLFTSGLYHFRTSFSHYEVSENNKGDSFVSDLDNLNASLLDYGLNEDEEGTSLNMLAFGDMMLGRHVRILMDEHGKNYLFEKINLKALQKDADLVHANLEGPIHGSGSKGGTSLVFSFNQDIAPFLKENGFNLLSISNNHALDQGWVARDETIRVLEENNIDWCGHPTEVDKNSIHYDQSPSGLSYAFVCFQDVTNHLDLDSAKILLNDVDQEVDLLIISVHWGQEYVHANNSRQQEIAHVFVDSGADLIIGHHPHVVQNMEIYNEVPIFYSLGNFVFDQYWSEKTQEGLALKLKITSTDYDIELIPMKSDRAQSRLMTDEEKAIWIDEFVSYGAYDDKMIEMIKNLSIIVKRK